jgi:lycopene cyclase domain-containing protein
MTYLWINLFSIAVPLIFSFHPKLRFAALWRAWLPAILLPAIAFIIWDVWFTGLGVWGFNPAHLSGVYLLNLPIEEWMFFFCIPYCCLFTYHALKIFHIEIPEPFASKSILGLGILVFSTALFNVDKWYTATAFFTATGLIGLLYFSKNNLFWKNFLPAYLVIYAIPFLIVNGLLTGAGLTEPIVWYNNSENLGIRVITIPIEDFIYGFSLYLSNVFLFEIFANKTTTASLEKNRFLTITHK